MTRFIRLIDLSVALLALVSLTPVFFSLTLICFFDTRSPFFIQTRLGQYRKPFLLLKFRTMKRDTPSLASHLVGANAVTRCGRFLRRTKLDELPQLLNVIKGDMSLVGPRPCLPNQHELIVVRERLGIFDVRPGITGLAQIKGIDMSKPALLAAVDREMIENYSVKNYFSFILQTVGGKGRGDRAIG